MKYVFTAIMTIGLLAQMSFAQDLTNTTNKKLENVDIEKTSGIEVGLIYSNLTDSNLNYENTRTNSYGYKTKYTESNKEGTHIGIAGLNVNYKNKTALNSFGYYYGGAIMQSFNKSEDTEALTFYKTQGGMSYSPISHFSLYTDLNFSYIDFKNKPSDSTVNPAFGMDLLAEYSIQNMSFQVGYQALGVSLEQKQTDSVSKTTGFISGITTQVSYMF